MKKLPFRQLSNTLASKWNIVPFNICDVVPFIKYPVLPFNRYAKVRLRLLLSDQPGTRGTGKRADAVRNQEKLLAAAAEVFVVAGVDAPVRQIAARAGVGTATIYRHFPTRADLIAAVFHYQVEECVEAGPRLLAEAETPFTALRQWIDIFVNFLVTKHGLASAIQSGSESYATLHVHFLDRLLPVCRQMIAASIASGEIAHPVEPYELLRAIGNLCIGREDDVNYTPQRMIDLLLLGLRTHK